MEQLLLSLSHDPAWNLGLEEALIQRGKPLVFLWQNGPSVILGRNQNPYLECDPELLHRDGVSLIRRKSGGGAVYHDLGNLNITILSEKSPDRLEENFRYLISVLEQLGLEAVRTGRNDLEIQGFKISGSAFYETETCLCHHCTLLIHVDREKLQKYLRPSPRKLSAKGIPSVASRVANLTDFLPGLTTDDVIAAFCRKNHSAPRYITQEEMSADEEVCQFSRLYRSTQWTYGDCPAYDLTLEEKFSWGLVSILLSLSRGKITDCHVYTDSLLLLDYASLSQALTGLAFPGPEPSAAMERLSLPEKIRRDINSLFSP